MRIFKYELCITNGVQELGLPKGAEILTAQMQGDCLMFWAVVYPHFETEKRYFSVYGTGHEMNLTIKHKYIATVQHLQLVWHVFECDFSMSDEPEYRPTSNPSVFLKDGHLYVKNEDGTFSPYPYEEAGK